MTKTQKLADHVFPAWKAVNYAQDAVEKHQQSAATDFADAVRFGIRDIDAVLDPIIGGDLVPVLGRPSHGKTFLKRFIFKNKIQQLIETGATNQAGIWVTYEVSIEREMMYWIAQEAGISVSEMKRGLIQPEMWKRFNLAAVRVGSMPVFLIGHTAMRDEAGRRTRPHLPTAVVSQALDYIMNEYRTEDNEPIEPAVIAVDYLQRIHKPERLDRQEHFLQCVDWAKDTALWGNCPVLLGVQAGRQVDDRKIQLPTMADGQWTSNIEQSADVCFSTWMPKASNLEETPEFGGWPKIRVSDNLLFLGLLKQKDGPAPKIFPLHVQPQYMKAEIMDPYNQPL